MSFAKTNGKNISNKYGQKIFNSAKKSTTYAIKTVSKRAIQKQKLLKNYHIIKQVDLERAISKKRYISPEE